VLEDDYSGTSEGGFERSVYGSLTVEMELFVKIDGSSSFSSSFQCFLVRIELN
jgi:hypothetical protein